MTNTQPPDAYCLCQLCWHAPATHIRMDETGKPWIVCRFCQPCPDDPSDGVLCPAVPQPEPDLCEDCGEEGGNHASDCFTFTEFFEGR